MQLIILILIGVGGFYLFKMWKSSQEQKEEKDEKFTPYSKDELRIENVGPGGVIQLNNIGPDMEDFDVNVIAKHTYREGGDTWYELEGEIGSRKVWIEIEEDDGLEVSITLRKLKLSDIGLEKQDLKRIDNDEEGGFTFEGQKYSYDDSGKATFLRYGEESNTEKVYYWDFEGDDEKHMISVEQWEDNRYDVSYSESIRPSQIKVYSLKK